MAKRITRSRRSVCKSSRKDRNELLAEIRKLRFANAELQKEAMLLSDLPTRTRYAYVIEAEERSHQRAIRTMNIIRASRGL